jgi:hypothetical protein
LDDDRLVGAVAHVAARRLGLPLPDLAVGAMADVVLFRRGLFEATPADVALVLVGGVVQVADAEWAHLFDAKTHPGEVLDVGGVRKVVAAPLASAARRVMELAPACGRFLAPAVNVV